MTSEQTGVDGGPAFPSPSFAVPRSLDAEHVVKLRDMQGMTLRDYFAAHVLSVLPEQTAYNMEPNETKSAFVARKAYEFADAMLKERSK